MVVVALVGRDAASGHSEEVAEHWTQQHNEQSNDYSYCKHISGFLKSAHNCKIMIQGI